VKQSRSLFRSARVETLFSLVVLTLTVAMCQGRDIPSGQCVFNADCPTSGDVCAGRFCRKACNSRPNATQAERDRDCPAGFTCRRADAEGFYACYPPGAPYRCVYHSECDQGRNQICARDGVCRNQCVTDYDCFVATLNRASMCIREGDAGSGTCDFRFTVDAGTDDAAAPSDAASTSDR
jgi:hypothetical protein